MKDTTKEVLFQLGKKLEQLKTNYENIIITIDERLKEKDKEIEELKKESKKE